MARISVVIPCYNSAATLAETLESACAQLGVDREILVADDGSTDETTRIARMFFPDVRIISGPHRGISATRNLAIAETRGDWIVFLDHDDLLLPRTLQKRLKVSELTQADVIVCDWNLLQSAHRAPDKDVYSVRFELLGDDPELACLDNVSPPPAALMYHRRTVEKIGGFREDLPVIQDQRFLFDAAYHGARFGYAAHLGACYRVQLSSFSRRNPELLWLDVLRNTQQIESLWRSRGPLSVKHRRALAEVYDDVARKFFAVGHPDYFRAVDCLRKVSDRLSLHPRIVAPLAAGLGLRVARGIVSSLIRVGYDQDFPGARLNSAVISSPKKRGLM
jgi:glycosyltransferase involved in cell wall biosynthesis